MDQQEILTITNLTKSYGSKEILKGIDLHISRGEIIGYIGPNGAGKSTTVKIILGIEGEYSGAIKLFGEDIGQDRIEYKRRIGYVPEIVEIYDNLTGYEYLTFISQLYGLELEVAADKSKSLIVKSAQHNTAFSSSILLHFVALIEYRVGFAYSLDVKDHNIYIHVDNFVPYMSLH